MADKKKVVAESETVASPKTTEAVTAHKPVSPLWWVLGTLIAVVFIMLLAGAFKQAWYQHNVGRYDRSVGFGMMDDERRMIRGGSFGGRNAINDDYHVDGVVTEINDSILTVAGNGETKKVTTNDKTEYYGAAQPVKVNDSVRIMGTTSGDTFTASRVMISRQ